MTSLTPKQARFVDEYLLDLNATQAAIRAGYRKHAAGRMGSHLLRDPLIAAEIETAKKERAARTQIDADWVLKRIGEELSADMADLYDDHGDLLPIEDWPLIWRQGLVSGVDILALYEGEGDDRRLVGQVKKLKLVDRTRRLELVGKHIRVNAFQEVFEHKGLNALADRLERAGKRLESDAGPLAAPLSDGAAHAGIDTGIQEQDAADDATNP
ncbi:terminase small subunit [Rhizobium sp. RM]|uniref:terminase small subunit n=1 Tax=Rhizobium sp. RM TaxID=2748079 RepID=UPI00110DB3BC|nr:terminase small subunit [Rhizobium sp. RM]NWJ26002.1 terminase small subunit [Rhizobium sp. RM]TMV20613.1 terminase small subunit [Rhizobium sp. Td3]